MVHCTTSAPCPPTHTRTHTHTPSVSWACLQVCPSPRFSSMPRPPCAWNKGGFPEWAQPAERSWPFSSGILQQGAHTSVAAPRRGEALRPRDSTLASHTLFPRWVGSPFHFGYRFVRLAGPPFRLCLDVAHSFQQAGLPGLPCPGRQRAPWALSGAVGLGHTWVSPSWWIGAGELPASRVKPGLLLPGHVCAALCIISTSSPHSSPEHGGRCYQQPPFTDTTARRWVARLPSRGPSPGGVGTCTQVRLSAKSRPLRDLSAHARKSGGPFFCVTLSGVCRKPWQ